LEREKAVLTEKIETLSNKQIESEAAFKKEKENL